jgi:hypothetical protein
MDALGEDINRLADLTDGDLGVVGVKLGVVSR